MAYVDLVCNQIVDNFLMCQDFSYQQNAAEQGKSLETSTEMVYIPIVDNFGFFVDNLWMNCQSLRPRVGKFKGWQLAQRGEAKLLQKGGRGGVENGAPRAHSASDFGDEGAGEEGA